jgi:uncharacterized protein (UPF0128 family)
MKKLLFTCFLLLITLNSKAQGVDLGIKAGINFAELTDASDLDNKTGYTFGLFAGIKFSDKIGIQGDLLYSAQGVDDIDLNYVNVPIVLRYFIISKLNVQVGPQFGFVVDDNVKDVFKNTAESKTFDLSGIVGLGYDLPLGFRVEGRYNFGFSDAVDNLGKNSVLNLSVGYSFL